MKKDAIIFGPHSFSFLNFRYEFIQQLKKKYNIILCGKIFKKDQERIRGLGVKFFDTNLNNSKVEIIKDLFIFVKIFNYFLKKKPSIVISYTIKSTLFAGLLSYFFSNKIKFFCFITGLGNTYINTENKKIKRKILIQFYKIILKKFNKLYFQNRDDLIFFKKNKIIKKNYDMNYITGVDIKRFKPEIFPKKISFLMISRIIENKGIEEYFVAARMLKKKYKDVNFYFAGRFEKSSYSFPKEKFNILSKNIIINLGWQKDVRKAIKKSSIVVLPSYREGLPRSIIEGMSMGRGIITSNVAGCKETIKNKLNGYFAKVKNSKSLENEMEKLILNRNLIKKFGKESRKIVLKKFDSKKITKELIENITTCVAYQE